VPLQQIKALTVTSTFEFEDVFEIIIGFHQSWQGTFA
jgi:hypothetical protein